MLLTIFTTPATPPAKAQPVTQPGDIQPLKKDPSPDRLRMSPLSGFEVSISIQPVGLNTDPVGSVGRKCDTRLFSNTKTTLSNTQL
jgi:hypothetical protein